jgi:lipopolysaccharide transport system permease protein
MSATLPFDSRPVRPPTRIGSNGNPFDLFSNLRRNRELLMHLVSRNIRSQYKQSILGYAWILLNPIAQLATLAFIFSVVFVMGPNGRGSFSLFLFVGLLPWIFFTNAITAATDSVAHGANLVTAVYFPREILVVAAVLVRVVDLIAGALILAVLIVESGQPLTFSALWVIPLFFLHLVFIVGLSLPLAALNLFFRDIRYLVGVITYLWFFLTPIFYSINDVPQRYRFVWDLNPNARLISSYRYALLDNVSPPIGSVVALAILSFACLGVGYFIFKKLEPSFAEHV